VSEREWTLAVWALLGALVVMGVAVTVLFRGRFAGPASLVHRITAVRGGRVVLVAAWMWLGWHAFAR
jgi:preprotein translocase subunit SecF